VENENVVEFKVSKDNKTFVYTYTGNKKGATKKYGESAQRLIKGHKVRKATEAWLESDHFPKLENFPYEENTYTHLIECTLSADEKSVDVLASVCNVTYTENMRQETTSYLSAEVNVEINGDELKLTLNTESVNWLAEDPCEQDEDEEEEEEGDEEDEDEEDFDGEEEEEDDEDDIAFESHEFVKLFHELSDEEKEHFRRVMAVFKKAKL